MKIAIASGKGGTGKTTLSVNIAQSAGEPVLLVDCDVEEPNCKLFLDTVMNDEEVVSTLVPSIDEGKCVGCGECRKMCQFGAIAMFGMKPMVFPEMCHGCGGCALVCAQGAITETPRRIGVIKEYSAGNVTLLEGCIDVGVAMAPPVIRELKKKINTDKLVIFDAPPGTTCPVVATLSDVDYVVLVTEPTPFGLNDLVLAVDMVREIGIPFGVVINRVGMGDSRVHEYCVAEGIEILMEILNDRAVAEVYSRGGSIVGSLEKYNELFTSLACIIKEAAGGVHSE